MRVRISHQLTHEYETPARSAIATLRLTPRNHEGQRVGFWRIDVDVKSALTTVEDAFGNITHTLSVAGPIERLVVGVDGEVETFDSAGVARGGVERLPPELFLRPTELTRADDALRAFAHAAVESSADPLDRLHALMGAIHHGIAFDPAPNPGATAAEALAAGRGAAPDFAHIFIACARRLGAPARYVAGYFLPDEEDAGLGSAHAWAEAFVGGLGWVGFDPVNLVCPGEGHVSVARGLDYLGASPIRSAFSGGGGEHLAINVNVSPARGQRQG